jgi:hypothetical protein
LSEPAVARLTSRRPPASVAAETSFTKRRKKMAPARLGLDSFFERTRREVPSVAEWRIQLVLSSNERTTVEQLGEAIADIAAGIHASTYQLLVLLHEFDERKGWNNGFLSCAHWLSWRTSIDMGAAREKVRVVRAR